MNNEKQCPIASINSINVSIGLLNFICVTTLIVFGTHDSTANIAIFIEELVNHPYFMKIDVNKQNK